MVKQQIWQVKCGNFEGIKTHIGGNIQWYVSQGYVITHLSLTLDSPFKYKRSK
jgi:hypothetical protein